jgi:hypothetical protein
MRELLHANNHNGARSYLITDPPALYKDLNQFRPEILIVDEWLETEEISTLMQKFHDSVELKLLIIVNLHENNLLLYRKQERSISGSSDLISIIKNSEADFS